MHNWIKNHHWIIWFSVSLIVLCAFIIRTYQLDQVPPSPYWEEVALGYDAYSILQTGKDHHGNAFPIVAFESFGDYKPTLYFYTIIPFIKLFGLSTLAVRLPSAIAGTLSVLAIGLLTQHLFSLQKTTPAKKQAVRSNLAMIVAMLVTTISPWAVQFSRAGWEVNLATCFITWGIWLGLKSWKGNSTRRVLLLMGSAVLFILSMYTYHATRIIAPMLGIAISLPWLGHLKSHFAATLPKLLGVLGISLVLLTPLLLSLGQKQTSQRFAETSIFSDISVIEKSNELIAEDGNTQLARLVHHRYILFGQEILGNFISHFHPSFLFLAGDANLRHSIQYMGQLYHIEFIFLVIGVYVIWFYKLYRMKEYLFLGFWLVVAILPASITFGSPHALRILPSLAVWMFTITTGVVGVVEFFKNNRMQSFIIAAVTGLYILQFTMFSHYYYRIYPREAAQVWQFGYQQMVSSVQQHMQPNQAVTISREEGRPAMYYWFYSKTNPKLVQNASQTVHKDQSEFLEFENITFSDAIHSGTRGLIASSDEKYQEIGGELLDTVTDLHGQIVWQIYQR